MFLTEEERRRCAYHEAGHAVAAYVQRRRFKSISIVENEESYGRVEDHAWPETFRPDIELNGHGRNRLEAAIIGLLAGHAAEVKYLGGEPDARADSLAEHDLRGAIMLGSYMCGSTDETGAYVSWLQHRATGLISNPVYWSATEYLAEALLTEPHMSYRRAREVIKAGIQKLLDERLAKHPVFGNQAAP